MGYASIQKDLRILDLHDEPMEYVISFNGGALTENKGNKLLQFKGLMFDKMKEIFEYGLTKDVCMHVYTKEKLYENCIKLIDGIMDKKMKYCSIIKR